MRLIIIKALIDASIQQVYLCCTLLSVNNYTSCLQDATLSNLPSNNFISLSTENY